MGNSQTKSRPTSTSRPTQSTDRLDSLLDSKPDKNRSLSPIDRHRPTQKPDPVAQKLKSKSLKSDLTNVISALKFSQTFFNIESIYEVNPTLSSTLSGAKPFSEIKKQEAKKLSNLKKCINLIRTTESDIHTATSALSALPKPKHKSATPNNVWYYDESKPHDTSLRNSALKNPSNPILPPSPANPQKSQFQD